MDSFLRHFLTTPQNRTTEHNSIESLLRSVPGYNPNPIEPQDHSTLVDEAIMSTDPEIDDILKESIRFIKKKKKKAPVYKDQANEQSSHIFEESQNEVSEEEKETYTEPQHLYESINMQETIDSQKFYKIYRDKDEIFECKISVEGTTLNGALVRLVLEAEPWNLLFPGKIYNDGRCVVPLKKMTIYPEGTIGKARLEVVVDEVMFVPWEETFKVEGAKKITVEVKTQSKPSISANFTSHNEE
jgi:hypothetical protein